MPVSIVDGMARPADRDANRYIPADPSPLVEGEVAPLQREARRRAAPRSKRDTPSNADVPTKAPPTPEEKKEAPPAAVEQKAGPPPPPEKGPPTTVEEGKAAAPTPDVWPESEVVTGLQECLKMLGPISAEIEIAPPTKSGACGTPAPIFLHHVGGREGVDVRPPALLNCRMVVALNQWVEKTLQPTSREMFGAPVTRLHGASGYSCRNRYGNPNDKISEHAFANAIDVTGFDLANGRTIDVVSQWGPTARDIKAKAIADALAKARLNDTKPSDPKASGPKASDAKQPEATEAEEGVPDPSQPAGGGKSGVGRVPPAHLGASPRPPADPDEGRSTGKSSERRRQKPKVKPAEQPKPANVEPPPAEQAKVTAEAAYLRRLHSGACKVFATVLGPEANDAHRNHFHLDMASRRRSSYCQ